MKAESISLSDMIDSWLPADASGQSDDSNITWHRPGVPRRQPHCHSGLATLPSVGAVP